MGRPPRSVGNALSSFARYSPVLRMWPVIVVVFDTDPELLNVSAEASYLKRKSQLTDAAIHSGVNSTIQSSVLDASEMKEIRPAWYFTPTLGSFRPLRSHSVSLAARLHLSVSSPR